MAMQITLIVVVVEKKSGGGLALLWKKLSLLSFFTANG